MTKRLFQKLDEMNLSDSLNDTRNVAISNTLVSAKLSKKGGLITMGVDKHTLSTILNDEAHVILICVNKREYDKNNKEQP